MEDKKKLTVVMMGTVEYTNRESIKHNPEENKEIPPAVHFINWVNSFEIEGKEGYIILKDK